MFLFKFSYCFDLYLIVAITYTEYLFFGVVCLIELYKMVCEPDETDLDIQIPAVMLPQDAGATLEKMLINSSKGTPS